ncbi:hypothetical protein BGY98DRAFT_985660 [Russula aff. rugulosa BPL654]|nr:hypothetical protein BGY98DRAFT_985660 [Russula aff. rugulosa BPL654]
MRRPQLTYLMAFSVFLMNSPHPSTGHRDLSTTPSFLVALSTMLKPAVAAHPLSHGLILSTTMTPSSITYVQLTTPPVGRSRGGR